MDVFLPPDTEFQNDITLLADLISYSAQHKTKLPEDFGRTFQLIRLADFLGVDPFLKLCAEQLDVPVSQLWNSNSIRKVRKLVRDRYRAHRCNRYTTDRVRCPICRSSLTCAAPLKADWLETHPAAGSCYIRGVIRVHQNAWHARGS